MSDFGEIGHGIQLFIKPDIPNCPESHMDSIHARGGLPGAPIQGSFAERALRYQGSFTERALRYQGSFTERALRYRAPLQKAPYIIFCHSNFFFCPHQNPPRIPF